MLRIEIERSEFVLRAGLYVQLCSAISHVFPKLCSEISSTLEVIVSPNLVVRRGPLPPSFRQHRPPSSPLVVGIPLPFTPFGDIFPVVQVLVSRVE